MELLREFWTSEQIQFLKEKYFSMTSKTIGFILGKSSKNVRVKAHRLNISTPRFEYEWSKKEITLLIDNYRFVSTYELSKILNRSIRSIHSFIRDNKQKLIDLGFDDKGWLRTCCMCEDEFYTYNNNQFTCSFECSAINLNYYQQNWLKEKKKKEKYTKYVYCMNCLGKFIPKGKMQKYCTKQCYKIHAFGKVNANLKENKYVIKKNKKYSDVDTLLRLYGNIE